MKKWIELYISFLKIGGLTFGGGMAMLPMLRREVVEEKHWTTEEELLDIYAIGQCTPGVIAVNTSTYIGYQQAGIPGAFFGTLGMVTPSLIIITLIATILKQFIGYAVVLHALSGIRIAVCALMLCTIISLAKAGIKDRFGVLIFLAGFLIATFTPVPTIALVLLAGVGGVFIQSRKERKKK